MIFFDYHDPHENEHSFASFSTLLGIREGTVASAVLIGLFVKQFKKPAEIWVKRVTESG